MKNLFSISHRLKSFSYAFHGIKILFQEEPHAWIHLLALITIHGVGFWLSFSYLEWAAVWICIGLVFLTELLNTAIENICDHVSEERHPTIGKIKDLAAAAVLVAAITSVVVALLIVARRF